MKSIGIVTFSSGNLDNQVFLEYHMEIDVATESSTAEEAAKALAGGADPNSAAVIDPFGIADLAAKHKAATTDLDRSIKAIAKSSLTAEINALVKERDTIWVGFVDTADAAVHHFQASLRPAGAKVMIVFKNYKNPLNFGYKKATAIMHNIIEDLNSEEYAEAAFKAGLRPWMSVIEGLNAQIHAKMDARDKEMAKLCASHLPVKVARANAKDALDRLFAAVWAKSSPGGNEPIDTLLGKYNLINARFAAIADKKTGGGGVDDVDTDDTDDAEGNGSTPGSGGGSVIGPGV